MGNKHIDILFFQASLIQCFQSCGIHMAYRCLEHFWSFHMYIDTARINSPVCHRFCYTAGRYIQYLAKTSIGSQVRSQKTISLWHFPNNRSSCTITKEDTGRTVMPVHQAGQNFCPHNQDMFVHTCLYQVRSKGRCINIAGAAGRNIHGPGMGASQFILYKTSSRRHYIIRGCRSYQDEINIIRCKP